VVAAEVGAELGKPDSGHVRLIHEAVKPPLQFPKSPEMIFQLRKASFASEKSVLEICELGAASRVGFAIPNLREEAHHRASRLRNADSKSFGFAFCVYDRRTHNRANEREPPFRGRAVALRRAKTEPAEAKHDALPNNRHRAMRLDTTTSPDIYPERKTKARLHLTAPPRRHDAFEAILQAWRKMVALS
jgi:hypothetical protein